MDGHKDEVCKIEMKRIPKARKMLPYHVQVCKAYLKEFARNQFSPQRRE